MPQTGALSSISLLVRFVVRTTSPSSMRIRATSAGPSPLRPGNHDVVIQPSPPEKLGENSAAARKEPGCRQFDVLVDPKDKTKVMLYEVYKDEKAFEAHQQTAHFKKYVAEAVPMLAARERSVWQRT